MNTRRRQIGRRVGWTCWLIVLVWWYVGSDAGSFEPVRLGGPLMLCEIQRVSPFAYGADRFSHLRSVMSLDALFPSCSVFVTMRAALRWAMPSCLMWPFWYGSQTEQQYSRVGLTSALYAVDLASTVHGLRFLRMKPMVLLAVAEILSMCVSHFKLFEMSTPRYECEDVSRRVELPKV